MDEKILFDQKKLGFIRMLMNESTADMVKIASPELYEAYQVKMSGNKWAKEWNVLYPEWFMVSDDSELEYMKAVRDLGERVYEAGYGFFEEYLADKKILNHFGYEDYCDVIAMELKDFNEGKITERKFYEYFLTQKELIYDDYKHIFVHLQTVDPLFVQLLKDFEAKYNLV